MRKKVFLGVLGLLMVLMFASCKARPDASLLPEPEVEFRAIKGIDTTEIKIQLVEVPNDFFGTYNEWGVLITYSVSDASGEVLFEAKATSLTQAEAPIYGTIDDVNAGDTLYCTTTFTFDGVTTTSTVTDVVE